MDKKRLVEIFEDTLETCSKEEEASSCFYGFQKRKPFKLTVTKETTLQAAQRICREDIYVYTKNRPTVLNFASGLHPGGGVKYGAMAQEESICRCSNLYPELLKYPYFYEENTRKHPEYDDSIIASGNVKVFKDEFTGELIEPFYIDVVTCPAPYSHEICDDDVLEEIFDNRIWQILDFMRETRSRDIILGAWGCGAFGNDPELVANSFKKNLEYFKYNFQRVIFPIYSKDESNYEVFKTILLGEHCY